MVIFLFSSFNTAYAFRCDCEIISIGDHKYTVTESCGEVISHETIGFTTGTIALKIEEIVYEQHGRLYFLKFTGNVLVSITSVRK